MKKQIIILWSIFFVLNLCAQEKEITHLDIWKSGQFYPKTIDGINSMKEGSHYTTLTEKGIIEYDYENGEEIKTVLSGNFSNYIFSEDENLILLEQNVEKIYRHSKKASYKVYNRSSKSFSSIFDGKKVQEPTFSPDGHKVAFVFNNNIYYQNLKTNQIVQVTKDGVKNRIINGITDWVYEEEFAFVRAFDWSLDGKSIAFIRFDESRVKEVNLPVYGEENYPRLMTFKYPKAGEENSKTSVHYYNLNSKKISTLDLADYNDFYIPKIKFNDQKGNDLFVFVSNRHQNKVDILKVDVKKNTKKVLFTETDKAWIDIDRLTFELEPEGIIWTSEKSGFNHLYLIDYTTGKVKSQITKGNWEVTAFYGVNKGKVYYQSTEEGSINRSIYSKSITDNTKQKLSSKKGWNDANFSSNFNYFINTYTDANTPHYITLNSGESGKVIKVLEENESTQQVLNQFDIKPKEFMSITTSNGDELNAWMIKPPHFKKENKYPVLMYV
ncbi:MAG: DPP IV N-terminal domain-containing protein, partial [Flavobacteriales bacterium]